MDHPREIGERCFSVSYDEGFSRRSVSLIEIRGEWLTEKFAFCETRARSEMRNTFCYRWIRFEEVGT